MELTDTHCHIHEAGFELSADNPTHAQWLRKGVKPDPDAIIRDAQDEGVTRLICVGTTLEDSIKAIDFVSRRESCWASIGIHPHEATPALQGATLTEFAKLAGKPKLDSRKTSQFPESSRGDGQVILSDGGVAIATPRAEKSLGRASGDSGDAGILRKSSKVVAIGECGLDYYYEHSSKADQEKVLRFQLDLASEHNLPVIFHIREAFEDFWPIYDEYKGIRGVIHSFSSDRADLEQILARGLYAGLNGIMTFTKNPEQLLAAKAIPLSNLLLETDAPFLTPLPNRGTICEPKHLCVTAEFLAGLRDEDVADIAMATTQNANKLFGMG